MIEFEMIISGTNPIPTKHCIIITTNSKTVNETTHCKQITLMFIYYSQ